MGGFDLHFDSMSDDCLKVLDTYAVREVAVRSRDAQNAGWLDRVDEIPGLDPGSLSTIHGILIAQGLLKFEITGRSSGLQYQISSSGRETLQRQKSNAAETETSDGLVEAPCQTGSQQQDDRTRHSDAA